MSFDDPIETLITTAEAASVLRVDQERIHSLVKAGMPHYRGLGRGFRFKASEILSFAAENFRHEVDIHRSLRRTA